MESIDTFCTKLQTPISTPSKLRSRVNCQLYGFKLPWCLEGTLGGSLSVPTQGPSRRISDGSFPYSVIATSRADAHGSLEAQDTTLGPVARWSGTPWSIYLGGEAITSRYRRTWQPSCRRFDGRAAVLEKRAFADQSQSQFNEKQRLTGKKPQKPKASKYPWRQRDSQSDAFVLLATGQIQHIGENGARARTRIGDIQIRHKTRRHGM